MSESLEAKRAKQSEELRERNNPWKILMENMKGPEDKDYKFPYPVSYSGVPGAEVWIRANQGNRSVHFDILYNFVNWGDKFYEGYFKEAVDDMDDAMRKICDLCR